MDYLVTGATGFVGNNVARRLLELGHSVRVMIRTSSDLRPLDNLDVERRYGDIAVGKSVKDAMEGVDAVIHAAANIHIGWRHMDEVRRVNVEGTRNIARAARESGAKMVHVSTVDALSAGKPNEPVDEVFPIQSKLNCTYVVTKREAEQAVLAEIDSGLHAVIVNPGFMLGPWDWKPSSGRMLLAVAKTFTPFAPAGGMSLCDVRDVVDATIHASKSAPSGRRYILAGHNVTYLEAWKEFARVTNSLPPRKKFGPILQDVVGMLGDAFAVLTRKETNVNSAMLTMSGLFHYYSSGRAQSELGYRIRPMEEIVQDAWHWFKEYNYA